MRRFWKRLLLRLAIVAIFALVGLLIFRSFFQDTLQELAQSQVKNATSDLTNDALTELLEQDAIAYDRIVYFEKDLNGKITAMKTNILEINRLKAKILALVNQRILELDTSQLGIPIGSLIFPEFFSGKGFRIPVHILSIRNSDAAFSSSFRQAGINQTLHCLTLEVEVDASTLVLGKIEQFSVSSQVAVAETIIVGDVPDTFFHTGGNYGTTEENTGSDGTA